MSPEQAQGKACEATADVFSLGAVLYRAVTGRRPFAGSDVPQMLFQVVYAQPPRPRDVLPSLPRDVEHVLAIALAKKPADRFGTALELAQALRAAVRGGLAPELRARGLSVATTLPWGAITDDQRVTRR
jgi:serine/threonine-protein kinase